MPSVTNALSCARVAAWWFRRGMGGAKGLVIVAGHRIAVHSRSNDKRADATFAGLAVQPLENGTWQSGGDRNSGRAACLMDAPALA